jgi:hypothetical protein
MSATMMISLPETIVTHLMDLRSKPDERLADVIDSLLPKKKLVRRGILGPQTPKPGRPVRAGKYSCEFLGDIFSAPTLFALFGAIVDQVHEIDSAVLDRFAKTGARTRKYVAREKSKIHPGNPNLPVMKTRSGWWISKNVGRLDVERALRALCRVVGFEYGKDIRFPAQSD